MSDFKGKNYRSASDLGIVPMERKQARQATITAIDNVRKNEVTRPRADTPYRAQKGEHMDVAKGFVHMSMPISVSSSVAFVAVSWLGLGIPVFSIATVAIMFGVFSFSYFGTWIISNLFSHYGAIIFSEYLQHNRLSKNDKFMRQQFKEKYKE